MSYALKIIKDIKKNKTRPFIMDLMHPMSVYVTCLKKAGRPGRLLSGFP